MINADKIKGRMREKRITQQELANILGISGFALYQKLSHKSQFTLDEALKIIGLLEIKDPVPYFFIEKIPNTQQ